MEGRRLVSLGLVAVLHVALIAALATLSRVTIIVPRAAPSEEQIWLLPPPPKKPVPPAPHAGERLAVPAALPRAAALPDYRDITIPDAPPAAASLGGLHGALFGCADLDKLSPEDRVRCGSALAVPENSVDFRDGVSRSQQAALWERGRLRKNNPLLLPCMNPNGAPNPLAVAACLAKNAIAGGFKPDEQPGYADKPEIFHLPNNGDPPDHPTGF
ncbi:MAG TPA: hypothetical protein VHZ78_12315 [Rhizomicrobium sp.]|jgi:hypothetical protein|nr:hypothetical protein [Rhizomicrobium sp.]